MEEWDFRWGLVNFEMSVGPPCGDFEQWWMFEEKLG